MHISKLTCNSDGLSDLQRSAFRLRQRNPPQPSRLYHQAKLDKYERLRTAEAIYDLELNPVRGSFDQAHLQAIHRRIFEKVYPWAGELRRVNISRPASYPFTLIPFLQKNLDEIFAKLASEGHLQSLAAAAFADRAAVYLGALNTLHPFREGNGRTQREFIRELALEAGHKLDWSRVTQRQMIEASILSHNMGKHGELAAVIRSAFIPVRRG
jgi:cell filamentation protein